MLALAFGLTSWLIDGMDVSGGAFAYLWVAALFGFVNAVIGTIVRIITLPLTLLTLGLFSIVVNAVMLELVDALSDHLQVDSFFWTAIVASITLAVVAVILDFLTRPLWVRA
jgi:putative membrane protein